MKIRGVESETKGKQQVSSESAAKSLAALENVGLELPGSLWREIPHMNELGEKRRWRNDGTPKGEPIPHVKWQGDRESNGPRNRQVPQSHRGLVPTEKTHGYERRQNEQYPGYEARVFRGHGDAAEQSEQDEVTRFFRVKGYASSGKNERSKQHVHKSTISSAVNGGHGDDERGGPPGSGAVESHTERHAAGHEKDCREADYGEKPGSALATEKDERGVLSFDGGREGCEDFVGDGTNQVVAKPHFGTEEMVGDRVMVHIAHRQGKAADCGHEEDHGYNGGGQWRCRDVGQDRVAVSKRSRRGLCDQSQSEDKNQSDGRPGKPQRSNAEQHRAEQAKSSKQRERETIDGQEGWWGQAA